MSGTISDNHWLNFKDSNGNIQKCYGFSSYPSGYSVNNPKIACKVGEDELYIPTSSSPTDSYDLCINNNGNNLYIPKKRQIDIVMDLYMQFPSSREMIISYTKITYYYINENEYRDFDEVTSIYSGLNTPSLTIQIPSYQHQQTFSEPPTMNYYGSGSDLVPLVGSFYYHGITYVLQRISYPLSQWREYYDNQTFKYRNTVYLSTN